MRALGVSQRFSMCGGTCPSSVTALCKRLAVCRNEMLQHGGYVAGRGASTLRRAAAIIWRAENGDVPLNVSKIVGKGWRLVWRHPGNVRRAAASAHLRR